MVLLDPGGTLSSSGLAGIMVPDVITDLPSLQGPVKTLGALSQADSDTVGPVCPTRMLSSSVCECTSPRGPVGLLPPCYDGTGLVPIAPTDELSSIEAVPFPVIAVSWVNIPQEKHPARNSAIGSEKDRPPPRPNRPEASSETAPVSWAPVVGRDVRSPCSDSESDDDVLSVGPMRPLLFAAPLGGARGHDDYMIQDDSLCEF